MSRLGAVADCLLPSGRVWAGLTVLLAVFAVAECVSKPFTFFGNDSLAYASQAVLVMLYAIREESR